MMDDNNKIPDMEPVTGVSPGVDPDKEQWERPADYDDEPQMNNSPKPEENSKPQSVYPYPGNFDPKQKPRRVGTVTLGVALIIAGVLLIWALFDPGFGILTIAKFSPVILILVGVEMIISYFRSDGSKVKYDFLSMFVCFLLICGSLIGVAVPTAIGAELNWTRVEERLEEDLEDTIYESVKDLGTVDNTYVYLCGSPRWDGQEYRSFDRMPPYEEILNGKHYEVGLRVYLRGDYSDKSVFVQDARAILDRLKDIPLEEVEFYCDGDTYYSNLNLSSPYQLDMTAEEMEKKVSIASHATGSSDVDDIEVVEY